MSEEITTLGKAQADTPREERVVAGFETMQGFELLQRQGKMLSQCSMLPANFKNNIPDCAIALEMSARMGYAVSPLLILQSIVTVHGKPTFEAKFVIGLLKSRCGYRRFDYEMSGKVGDAGEVRRTPRIGRDGKPVLDKNGNPIFDNEIIRDGRTCLAYAIDRDGNRIEGVPISMAMAKVEGWYDKNGSKWQTMPELMLRYRAATFFKNIHCPEITMGFRTSDEAIDIDPEVEIIDEAKPKQKLFKAKKTTEKAEEPAQDETVAEPENPAATPAEAPKKDGAAKDIFEELADRLEAEGLTQGQCVAYAGKNGMLVGGKIDEFAAQKILNAWDVVKGFIAREDAGDDI